MKKTIAFTLAAASIATFGTTTTFAAENSITKSVPVYRLYNTTTGEHFYTEGSYEKNHLVMLGWKYEGIGWNAAITGAPVYRVYNPNAMNKGKAAGDHYYTQSLYEAKTLVSKGWKWDNNANPVFYSGGKIPVYVAFNSNVETGTHNYTTSQFEQASLLKIGWKYGSVAWNTVSQGVAVPQMNVRQLASGNFSSVQGVWQNAKTGKTLIFKGNTVTGTALKNEIIPLKTGSMNHNIAWVSADWSKSDVFPTIIGNSGIFMFASANTSPSDNIDATNKTQDRLGVFTNGGNAVFGASSASDFYYRIE